MESSEFCCIYISHEGMKGNKNEPNKSCKRETLHGVDSDGSDHVDTGHEDVIQGGKSIHESIVVVDDDKSRELTTVT